MIDLQLIWVCVGMLFAVIGLYVNDEKKSRKFLQYAIFCALMAIYNILKTALL